MTAYVPDVNERDLQKVIRSLQQLAAGRSNAVGTVTLDVSSATTVVSTRVGTCAPGSVPLLVPTTANAATEFGAGSLYISGIDIDTFTVNHVNSGTTGRTFLYVIVG